MFLKEALTSGSIESQIKDYIRQRKIFHYKSILLQKFETWNLKIEDENEYEDEDEFEDEDEL